MVADPENLVCDNIDQKDVGEYDIISTEPNPAIDRARLVTIR